MTTDIKELLPCPFCNSDMSSVVQSAEGFCHSGSTLYVPCDCGAMGPEGKTIDDAIAAWNRRTPIQLSAQTAVKTEQPSLSDERIDEIAYSITTKGLVTWWRLFAREIERISARRQDSDKDAETWRVARETVVEIEGQRPILGYCYPVDWETFDSFESCSAFIRKMNLELGWCAVKQPQRHDSDKLAVVHKFLLGEGPLDGLHFGDVDTKHPRAPFWWRKYLRAAIANGAPK